MAKLAQYVADLPHEANNKLPGRQHHRPGSKPPLRPRAGRSGGSCPGEGANATGSPATPSKLANGPGARVCAAARTPPPWAKPFGRRAPLPFPPPRS